MWFESKRVTGHWQVSVCIGSNKKKPPQQQRVRAEWCRHPAYQARLDALCKFVRWDALSLDEQSLTLKEFQRAAALFARDHILANEADGHFAILTRLLPIARCVWAKDVRLCRFLMRHSSLAREHFYLEDGIPFPSQSHAFEEAVRSAKAEHSDRARADLESDSRPNFSRESPMRSSGRKKAKAVLLPG